MLKIKSVVIGQGLGLLLAGTNAYAVCTPNITNASMSRTSTLSSSSVGDCVENSGAITISGATAFGIYSTGASATNTNSGVIVASGQYSFGVFSDAASSINSNSGTITTSGSSSSAIYSNAANSTNTNSGTITTSGQNSHGIESSGANSTNSNSGTITTSGWGGSGIKSFANSTNSNSGTITTSGPDGYGIWSSGASSINSNSGTITTSGQDGYGILSNGANSTITNVGIITTSGGYGFGINSTNSSVITTNSGMITTSGQYGSGIWSLGVSSTNTNSGTITTSGTSGYGIRSLGVSSTNTNSGVIVASGQYSFGIVSNGANSINTNSGTITTSGLAGHGIYSLGANSTTTNSGTIRSTGADSAAIYIEGNGNTVNLNRGSIIVGDIFAHSSATGAQLNLNLGAGASYAYQVTGSTWTVSDFDNRPMVTGSAYAAGIGAQETAAEMLHQRTSVITSALDRRLRSYASDDVDNQPYWLDVYYADVSRNAGANHSTQTAFSNHNYGITAGFKLSVEVMPLELVINAEQSNLNIDSGNQKIDSTSLMVGVLAPSIVEVMGTQLSAKALFGYADYDGDRKVMTNSLLYDGSRQIKSDYDSIYAVLGTALTKLHPITDRLTADVMVGLDLNMQRIESYNETDYFAWDSRTLTQLQSRVQMGVDYKLLWDKASVFARLGAEHRDLIGGATQDYSINGTNVSFNTNNKRDTYLTAQVGIKAQLEKSIQLFGIVNTLHSSDSVDSVSGNIGLKADF